MLELPGWNDLISVNGFCYSSSMGESPKLNIPLKTSVAPTKGIAPATFARNSTATYIDPNGVLQTAAINVPRFQNGRYLAELVATNIFLQSGTPATQTITVVSGSKYTVSCYGSGSIVLSGAGTGTVVQGTPVTFTAASTTLTCVPSAIDKAQVELGSKATSYIPTTTAPMTRAADVLHYDVGSVITQGQGSLYCYGIMRVVGQNQRLLNLSDNTTSNRLYITLLANGTLAAYIISGSTTQVSLNYGIPLEGGIIKALLTYKNNNASFYVNGGLVGTDRTCQIPENLTKLNVGCSLDGTAQLNSEIGNVKYFKEVLTPAEAIKLTTV